MTGDDALSILCVQVEVALDVVLRHNDVVVHEQEEVARCEPRSGVTCFRHTAIRLAYVSHMWEP